jgi:AraC-like DNA-binding protein
MNPNTNRIISTSEVFFATPGNLARKLFFFVTCTGHYYYEDGYRLIRDHYNSFLIMHILSGSAKVSCNEKEYMARKGDTVFMNCYKPHGYEACGELETLWLHFDGPLAAEYFNEINGLNECIISLKDSYPVISGLQKIFHMHKSSNNINEAVQSAYISRILAALFSNPIPCTDQKNCWMEATISYIEDHISEELSNKVLAKNVSISEFHFSRIFKKESGYTVQEYITKIRITSAKVLLKNTSLSLKEIAYRCGFSNESSFSNAFKRNTAMSPGKFRSTVI